METEFTPWLSLAGGILIGLAATALMAAHGRIAGMTGILGGILPPYDNNTGWRIAFLTGAVTAPLLATLGGQEIGFAVPVSTGALIVGGLIVGLGVTFGAGCTSGHGVCGMARLSPRSIAATATFMIASGLTVYVVRHILGGL